MDMTFLCNIIGWVRDASLILAVLAAIVWGVNYMFSKAQWTELALNVGVGASIIYGITTVASWLKIGGGCAGLF